MDMQSFAEDVRASPDLRARLAQDPEGVVTEVAARAPLQSDVTIYRMVVAALGLTLIGGMLGALVLAFWGKEVPAEATALGSAAVGALAGLLAPSPRQ